MECINNLRIVLLGKTGSGKSATGNTILGRKAFGVKFSSESVTQECSADDEIVDGQKITVIDTPGLYDTSMNKRQLKHKIAELFNYSGDAIHVFLLVIKLGTKFTEEERNTVQWVKDNYGEEATKNTIVLFTNGDDLEYHEKTIEQYKNDSEILKSLVEQCNGRYQVFKNRTNDRSQVTELVKKIKKMIEENNNELYTKKKYETQNKLFRANLAGGALGGVLGAGAAGGTAAVYGAAKATVIGATAVGGVGVGVAVGAVAGALGVGAAVYKYSNRESSAENKDKKA